jgi:cell division protein FtsI (penicillin-binding protein 3)
MDQQKAILRRLYIVFFLICLFAFGVAFKLVSIQLIEGDKWISRASNQTTVYKSIPAVRGNIYASGGSLLATSVPIYEVRWDSQIKALSDDEFNIQVDSLSIELAQLFKDKTPLAYKRELVEARNSGSRYHLVKRNVNYNQLKKIKEFHIFRRGKYKGGFIYHQQNKREKPFRALAARTIGYERDGVKPVGLEGAYSATLSGINGRRLMQKIAGGVWMPINDENEIEPKDGADIITTIDLNIQDVAHHALKRQLEKQSADHGCVVLMEVNTGNVKAIVNLTKGADGEYYELYNYAIGESTEPGSTFKLPAYMVALEDGYIDIDDTISTGNGKYKFYDTYMYDSREGGYGTLTVKDAFAFSSNIAVAKIISKYYSKNPQAFIDRLYKMNLNKPLDIEIFGEGKPQIKSADNNSWSGISLPWMSHGYEVQQTPLQILAFYNAVANDGVLVKPKFVEEIREYDKVIEVFDPIVINPAICSKATIKKVKAMLEGVVEYGTAANLRNANYKIAGKTGTAQIANAKYGYKYESKVSHQASFCGYFPADNPKYSCIVVVNAPSRNVYYGNLVAGPIFKEIADKTYATSVEIHDELAYIKHSSKTRIPVSKNGHLKDITKVFEEMDITTKINDGSEMVISSTGDKQVQLYGRKISKGLVPNVMGMDLKDAVYVLENAGLNVKVLGKGTVKSQSIPNGRKIEKGAEIILELA